MTNLTTKQKKVKEGIKRAWYRMRATLILWRLPKSLNSHLENWMAIDHRKDRSLSGRDFRFYLYNRLCNGDKI